MSTSRLYHHGALREALLDATRALLDEVGVEGLSLREVSRRTGVSHTAAYNHFRDKASLLRAVVGEAFADLGREMRRARASTRDEFEGLLRMGVAYVRFAYRNPAAFKIMFRPELCSPSERVAAPGDAETYRLLVEAVEDAQRSGAIAAGPRDPPVLAAWAMVHGLASLIVDGPNPALAPTLSTAETLARGCVATLAQGLRARGPA